MKTSSKAKEQLKLRYKSLNNYIEILKEIQQNYCIEDFANYELTVIINDLETIAMKLKRDVIHHGE